MDQETSTFRVEFGRRLQRRRRILGLTQREVGERIGLQRSHITQLERGGYQSMKLEQLAMLADVLQTSLDYLLLRTADDPGTIPPRRCPAEGYAVESLTPLPVTTTPRGDYSYAEYTAK